METSAAEAAPGNRRQVRRGTAMFRAPRPTIAVGLILALSAVLAVAFWSPRWTLVGDGFVLVFAGPALLAAALTTPLAVALGGRFEYHRAIYLSLVVLMIETPIVLAWRGFAMIWPAQVPGLVELGTFLIGPAFWFRHLSLYGVSRTSHARMLLPSLLQPLVGLAGLFVLLPPPPGILVAGAAFLIIAFLASLMLLRAADRPLRREFQASGVALIRPLLDHVGLRDPDATRALESFFDRTAIPADLTVSLFAFRRAGTSRAAIALPTVHPGPFAALGASDLPRKLAAALGPAAGVVFVPHTPCDHDLDLPSGPELDKVADATRRLFEATAAPLPSRASPLVSPYAGSLARAQMIGGVALLVVTQAPAPTDDIAYSVGDRIVRELAHEGLPPVALIDAHNSYIEGQGDILYGTPTAEKLVADATAAVRAAVAAARDGPVEVGVATRTVYDTGRDGIASQGLRALVVRAAGTTTAYLLIDGNNLLVGLRAPIVEALGSVVGAAEVLTTDNHVVHEVDGGINAVGERYPRDALVRDSVEVVREAVADLGPVDVSFGTAAVPAVRVLGPGYTARLLTSLGDTLSMFTNMIVATFLLLVTASLVVVFVLR